jgi:hypothetical protein
MAGERARRAGRAACAGLALAALALAPRADAAPPGPGPLESASVGTAAKPARSARIAKDTPTHWWHDGTARRALVLDRSLEADFSPAPWRAADVLRPAGAAPKSAAPLVSPVLRDASGRARALPGGVLVVLKAPLDEAAARALIAGAGATPTRQVSSTVWLLEGPPGLASLELANRLHAGGQFAAAQPNWWVQRTLK